MIKKNEEGRIFLNITFSLLCPSDEGRISTTTSLSLLPQKKRGMLILLKFIKQLNDNSISVDGMKSVPFIKGFVFRLSDTTLAAGKSFFFQLQ